MQTVALATHLDEMPVMHEPIEEGRDRGSVTEQLRPVLERTVRGNDC
jgi:hypothetical protein